MRPNPRACASLAVALAVVAATALGQAQAPAPASGTGTPTGSLARFAPKEKLAFYLEFAGTDAHASAWAKTAASKILNDTPTGAMLEDIVNQLLASAFASSPAAQNTPHPTPAELTAIFKHAARSGVMVAAQGKPSSKTGVANVIVFPGAWRDAAAKATFAPLVKSLVPVGGKVSPATKPGNRSVVVATHPDGSHEATYWIENKTDLVIADDADAVIAALDKPESSAAGDPTRRALFAAEDGAEPLAGAFVDPAALPPAGMAILGGAMEKGGVGAKAIQRVEYRLGLRGEDLIHDFRLVMPGPRSGALALFDGPKFDAKAIPPMPDGVKEFSALSLDFAKLYDQVRALAKQANPAADETFQTLESTVKGKSKLRLREDVLGRFGPRVLAYTSPKAKAAATSSSPLAGLGAGGLQVPKGAILVEIKDPKAVGTMLDQLMLVVNRELKSKAAAAAPPPAGDPAPTPGRGARGKASTPSAPAPEFKLASNSPKTYNLSLPTAYSAMTNLRLTVAVGKKYLVIGTMPDATKEALAVESKATKAPTGDAARAVEGLPPEMMLLEVSDPSDTLPEALAKLPESLNAAMASGPLGGPAPVGSTGAAPPPGPGGADASAIAGGGGRPGGRGRGAQELPSVSTGGPPAGGAGAHEPAKGASPGGGASPAAGLTLKVDAAKLPSPDAVRKLIGPSSLAIVSDAQSIRLVVRHSFPDLGTWAALPVQIQGATAAAKMFGAGGPAGATPPGAAGSGANGPRPPGQPGRRGGGNIGGID